MPAGLTIDPVTGIISGTPEYTQTATEYTIYAANSSATTTAVVSITINHDPPTALSYSTTSAVYTRDEAITDNTPTVTGTVTSWTVNPALPDGLIFDSSTGVISGTPTALQTATDYTITAGNSGGSTSTTISITVNLDPPSALSYSTTSAVYTRDEVISNNIPTFTGTVTSWSVEPELPHGLTLDSATGVISGIPDSVQAAAEYTVTASNGYGEATARISITVNLAAPTALSYSTPTAVYTRDLVITPNTPTITGTVTSWSVSPDLPHGLTLNTTTGVITGTPDTEQAATSYTITATNSGGSTTASVSITVNLAAPSGLSYSTPTAVYTRGLVITPNTPTVTGTVTSWSVSPGLPHGLTLNTTTGIITGTPDTEQAATSYTITATNSGGSATASVSITVNLAAPSALSYSTPTAVYTRDQVITPNTPTVTGTVTSWSVSPGLPHGLTLNTTTGVITGTPDTLQAATSYTITASNSSGSTTATISIEVTTVIQYTVTYNANGGTSGSPPTDSAQYAQGDTVTVLDNSGDLAKEGYAFTGWNTQANGSGTGYTAGQTFAMGASNVTLYAIYTISEIMFETSGSSFSPVVIVTGSPAIEWTFGDGTTSSSATPTKDYGTTGTRKNYLRVTPWSAVKRINIGYDASDGGSTSIEVVADQKVTSVAGLELVAPYLQQWCSSFNNIISLDFSNFILLDTIECYHSYYLQTVNLANTPALLRACLEDCNLSALDLSQSPKLKDIRGALNTYTNINFGSAVTNLAHICVRDNPQITNTGMFSNMSQFPKIEELFIWNDNQYGALNISSTGTGGGVFIYATQNHYTSANFSGAFRSTVFNGIIYIDYNSLTSLNIDGCIQLSTLDARHNQLGSASIDYILTTLDSLGRTNGHVYLSSNAAPTSAGLTAKANLIAKGWVVDTD